MYTLTICYGMFLGICGQQRSYDFDSRKECEKERAVQEKYVGDGWAICAPKKLAPKKQDSLK